jgi:hypothetical protein
MHATSIIDRGIVQASMTERPVALPPVTTAGGYANLRLPFAQADDSASEVSRLRRRNVAGAHRT